MVGGSVVWELLDGGGENGTFLNGSRVAHARVERYTELHHICTHNQTRVRALTLSLSLPVSFPPSFSLSLSLALSFSPSLPPLLSLFQSLYFALSVSRSCSIGSVHTITLWKLSNWHIHRTNYTTHHQTCTRAVSLSLSFSLFLFLFVSISLSSSLFLSLSLSPSLACSLSPSFFLSHSPSLSLTHSIGSVHTITLWKPFNWYIHRTATTKSRSVSVVTCELEAQFRTWQSGRLSDLSAP